MDYKNIHQELKRINYPENQYLFYRAKSIVCGIIEQSTDSDIISQMTIFLAELNKIQNPFNFDKSIKSSNHLSILMEIVAGAESYLESKL